MAKRRWRDAVKRQTARIAAWEAIRNEPDPRKADRAAFQLATREILETADRSRDQTLARTIEALNAALVRHSAEEE